MPDIPDPPTPAQAQEALRVLTDDAMGEEALRAACDVLADAAVLVPVVDPEDYARTNRDPRSLPLPVLDHADGVQTVPVFTSEERLSTTLPSLFSYRLASLGRLASGWPDNELQLVIDAGHPDALTLTAEGVRSLLARP